MSNGTIYFPHDSNSREDEKVIHLLSEMGWMGYGIYWAIIERLHSTNDGWMDADCERLAFALRTEITLVKQVIHNFNLFKHHEKRFTSVRVLRNLREIKRKSSSARKNANMRWDKVLTKDADAMRSHCERNAINKRKVNKRKESFRELSTRYEQQYREGRITLEQKNRLLKEYKEYED